MDESQEGAPNPAQEDESDFLRVLRFYLHRKYKISDFKNRTCMVLNDTTIASGYASCDPQGWTSDGSFL